MEGEQQGRGSGGGGKEGMEEGSEKRGGGHELEKGLGRVTRNKDERASKRRQGGEWPWDRG